MQTLLLKLTVTAVKLLHQRLIGADPDAMPRFMVAPITTEIFEFKIRVVEVCGAIKDSLGGLLQAV